MRKVPVLTIVGLVAALALAPVVQAQVANAPDANDNNRVVGVAGGNIFFNGVAPGGSVASVAALGLEGSASGEGATGALIATVADMDGNLVDDSGLSPMIDADGAYTVDAAADFSGAYIVSFGDAAGNGASLVVASAAAADLSAPTIVPPEGLAAGTATPADGAVTVEVATGQGVLAIAPSVEAAGVVTVSLDYETTSTALNIAVIGFDGALAGTTASYSNPGAGNLEAGVVKTLAVTLYASAGSVLPAFQVANAAGDAATVVISNLQVISGGAVTDYAAGAADVDIPALNTWGGNINGIAEQGMPVADGDGVALNAADAAVQAVNAFTPVDIAAGEVTVEAAFAGANAADVAFFVLMLTDGVNLTVANFASADAGMAVAAGTSSSAATAYLVIQAAGFDAAVSEVVVTQVADGTAFDPALLGG